MVSASEMQIIASGMRKIRRALDGAKGRDMDCEVFGAPGLAF
jgi:hypothetical protein